MGFRISDYSSAPGFTRSDFDQLARTGAITIADDDPGPPPATSASRSSSKPSPQVHRTASSSTRLSVSAIAALTGSRHALNEADGRVPDRPGLYAIYGTLSAWQQLGLGALPDERPLYVGKAEDSLAARDLRTHFGDGRTGQSTVRRSVAALLRETLNLHAIPRNPAKPDRFSNYGLSPQDDARLTEWMRSHLALAVWVKPDDVELIAVERAVLAELLPPLNLKDVVTPSRKQLSAARKAMAEEAKQWAARRDSSA